jgi:hypothetical protein
METKIPNQYHFVFGLKKQLEPFHLMFYICIESCLQINKPDRMFFYYHYEPYGRYWDLVKEKLTLVQVDLSPAVLQKFHFDSRKLRAYSYAQHSDFIRLEKLYEHGGIYADLDTIFVHKMPDDLYTKPFVMGHEVDFYDKETGQTKPSLCNAFLMSQKGAEFANIWLKEMENAWDSRLLSKHSTLLPYELSRKYPQLVHVLPQRAFFHHSYTPEGIRTLFEGCDTNFEGIYSLHLWSHLWWSRWRRDFSTFHAGRLTEEYIRRVDTTYNILARPFLPSPGKSWPVQWSFTRRLAAIFEKTP